MGLDSALYASKTEEPEIKHTPAFLLKIIELSIRSGHLKNKTDEVWMKISYEKKRETDTSSLEV